MYTRGQFAAMCNIGRKALRLYHEDGILVPVYINKDNGYHYYDDDQIETVQKIKQLRKLGLSIFEIRQIIDGNADEKAIIESKINETGHLLEMMKEYTIQGNENTASDTANIDRRPFSAECIYVCENTEREVLGRSIGKLYERASKEGLGITGDHFVVFDCTDDNSFSMKTCLPVTGAPEEDRIVISEEDCIHICFKDGFSKIHNAHRTLRKYADSIGITLSERIYEVYHKDMTADIYYAINK